MNELSCWRGFPLQRMQAGTLQLGNSMMRDMTEMYKIINSRERVSRVQTCSPFLKTRVGLKQIKGCFYFFSHQTCDLTLELLARWGCGCWRLKWVWGRPDTSMEGKSFKGEEFWRNHPLLNKCRNCRLLEVAATVKGKVWVFLPA